MSIRAAARLRALALVLLLIAATVVAITVPLPRPEQIREWAQGLGPSLPAVFLICHALITVAPIPRTVFTLAAGLLFGPLTGISVALVASTISAVLALLLVRKLGRDVVAGRLRQGALQKVDARLDRRGWLAVVSLRLIPVVPFSLLNYCCGVSAVRLKPYVCATIVGIAPGTVAVVLLGNAITGRTSPVLVLVSIGCGCLGLLGLVADARAGIKDEN